MVSKLNFSLCISKIRFVVILKKYFASRSI